MSRKLSRVGVVGLGTMGAGIAEVFARSGLDVVGVEVGQPALDRGRDNLERSTGRAVSRGRLSEQEQQAVLGRIALTTDLDLLADRDLVLEVVPERMDMKRALFAELDRICGPDALLATNTSSLSVTEIAMSTERPGSVLGMHFFNPAPVMKLVEVVHTVRTDPAATRAVEQLCMRLGKTAVQVGDRAGFIANKLLLTYLGAAARLYESRVASREDLDDAMKLGFGLPMGPLTLLDLIGLDTSLSILDAIYAETGDRLHAPPALLRQLVAAGLLGRKSGRGFYDYPAAAAPAPLAGRPVQRLGVLGGDEATAVLATAAAACGITVTAALDAAGLADCDVVLLADGAALAAVAAASKPGTVLAMVGSGPVPLPAGERAADVVGLHAVGDTVVEVVATFATAPAAVETAAGLLAQLERRAVRCHDTPGRLAERLLYPYLNEAVRMLETGYAGCDDIDAVMTLGCGYPDGPFAQLDRIGAAAVLAGLSAIAAETGEPGLTPAPLLRRVAAAGRSFREPVA